MSETGLQLKQAHKLEGFRDGDESRGHEQLNVCLQLYPTFSRNANISDSKILATNDSIRQEMTVYNECHNEAVSAGASLTRRRL